MHLSFICNYIHINGGWSPWDTRVGGSEEFIIETSKRLVERGHEVTVYHNGQHGMYEGVEYRDHEDFSGGDLVVNVNYPQFQCDKHQVLWTSLTDHPDLSHFKAVGYISEYAKANTYIHHKNLFWVPPGYDNEQIYPGVKIPKQCLYASSPDRGLDTLLEAWPQVHKQHPDATLIVTYGGTANLPGVINLGEVDNETMNELYRTSDIWCHPANGGELYCITGIKAQAAGCWPVIIPAMALTETVKYGTFTNKEHYAEALINALSKKHEVGDHKYPTWEDTTDKLLDMIQFALGNRE